MDVDSECANANPFAFLHIHGAADSTIKIDGGVLNFHQYTSAVETLDRVAKVNQCVASFFSPVTFAKKDFDPTIPGRETTVQKLDSCAAPIVYWRIANGPHSPKLPANYGEQILTFLAQNSR
jgi:polyhydroxybutyrate depolymerase